MQFSNLHVTSSLYGSLFAEEVLIKSSNKFCNFSTETTGPFLNLPLLGLELRASSALSIKWTKRSPNPRK